MTGMAAWQNWNVPVRLMRSTRSQSSAATSWLCSKRRMPALFTRTSSRPSSPVAVATACAARRRVADVADERRRPPPGSSAPLPIASAAAASPSLVAVDRDHRGALVDQALRGRPADAGRGTGDDGDPSLEALHPLRLERVLVSSELDG